MIRCLALLSLLLASACIPVRGDDAKDPSGDGGEDTTGGGDPAVGPCPAYSGLEAVGNAWTYGYTAAFEREQGYTYTDVGEVVAFDVAGDEATVVIEWRMDLVYDNGDAMVTTLTSTSRCDAAGLNVVSWFTEWTGEFGGTPIEGWSTSIYASDEPSLPHGIAVGSTWDVAYTVTYEDSNGAPPSEQTRAYSVLVEDTETIEVPAGTFETLRLATAWEDGGVYTTWDDRTVGSVFSGDNYQLEAYAR